MDGLGLGWVGDEEWVLVGAVRSMGKGKGSGDGEGSWRW